jgi:acyl carrier protein
MSLEDKVKEVIVDRLGVNPEQVTPQASLVEDLGADSLDLVELVMAFEDKFGMKIPDQDAEKLRTVGAIIDYLKSKGITE